MRRPIFSTRLALVTSKGVFIVNVDTSSFEQLKSGPEITLSSCPFDGGHPEYCKYHREIYATDVIENTIHDVKIDASSSFVMEKYPSKLFHSESHLTDGPGDKTLLKSTFECRKSAVISKHGQHDGNNFHFLIKGKRIDVTLNVMNANVHTQHYSKDKVFLFVTHFSHLERLTYSVEKKSIIKRESIILPDLRKHPNVYHQLRDGRLVAADSHSLLIFEEDFSSCKIVKDFSSDFNCCYEDEEDGYFRFKVTHIIELPFLMEEVKYCQDVLLLHLPLVISQLVVDFIIFHNQIQDSRKFLQLSCP